MRLQRAPVENNEFRGLAYMVLTCSCKDELDNMVDTLNIHWKRDWGTIYEEGERVGSMATQYIVYIDELDTFKDDYKAAKAALKLQTNLRIK
jgi:hypothetical protein